MKAVQSATTPAPEARQRPARPPRRKRKKLPTPKIAPAVATETALAEKLRALQDHFHGSNRQ
jgi:hypothetical protein